MTEHKWEAEVDGAERCIRNGCTVRRFTPNAVWQRKKGAHWRRETSEPIPPCNGEES